MNITFVNQCRLKVYGMSDGHFLVNHYWISGSIILFPKRFYMWNILEASEIKPHTLEIMNFVKPRPDYLIIGTGEKSVNLDFSFYEHFRRMGITVDTCPSVIFNSFIVFSLKLVVLSICVLKMIIMLLVLCYFPGLVMRKAKTQKPN